MSKLTKYLGLLLFGVVSYAQEFSAEYLQYKSTYPESAAVDLKDYQSIFIDFKNGELVITYDDFSEKLYLDRRAKFGTESSISYSSFTTLKDIEASSFSFENGKYRKNKVEKFTERDVTEDNFYNDIKEVKFIFPKLSEGAISTLGYTKEIHNPRFLIASFFGARIPLVDKKLQITVHKDVEIDFFTFNMDEIPFDYTVKKKGKKMVHTWEAKGIPPFEDNLSSISFKEYIPHIVPIIKSYPGESERIRVLGEPQDLFNWYASMTNQINKEPLSPKLEALSKDLVKDATTELDKVRAVYYWTQQQIKYIDVEYGYGGFIPRDANQVYEQKYGDCKDNSSLMQAMLDAVGVKSYLTWVGTRTIPYTYEELPTPMVDNHMILTYKDEETGKYYFLDATGRYLELGLPSSFIQGKEVMIKLDDTQFELYTVPYVEYSKNKIKETNTMQIKENDLVGTTQLQLSGYEKTNVLSKLENRKGDKKIDLYRNRFSKGNNKYILSNLQEQSVFEYDKDLLATFDFEIQNYVQAIDNQLFINLNLNDQTKGYDFGRINERDISIKHQMSFEVESRLAIPEGYTIASMPDSVSISNPFFDMNISYYTEEDTIVYIHNFNFKTNRILQQEQEKLKSEIKKSRSHLREMIVLQKQ